jgi:hypothetical protein
VLPSCLTLPSPHSQVDTQRREFLASAEEQLRQVEAEWQGKLEAATSAHLVDRKRMALLEQDLQVSARERAHRMYMPPITSASSACGVVFRCVLRTHVSPSTQHGKGSAVFTLKQKPTLPVVPP